MAKAGPRKEALSRGETVYFTGNLCPNGHVSKRYVSDKSCLVCRADASAKQDSAYVKAKSRKWYLKNTERNKERTRKWRKLNPGRDTENARAWRAANKELIQKYAKETRKKHPHVSRYHNVINSAKIRGKSGNFTREALLEINIKQGNKCNYCQKNLDKFHYDHIIPIALNGENTIENLQALCPRCNLRKGKMHPDAFKRKIAAENAGH